MANFSESAKSWDGQAQAFSALNQSTEALSETDVSTLNREQRHRQTYTPTGFTDKELEGFFMISSEQAGAAILCRITGTQARLWLYLLMIDRFADRTLDGDRIYHDIPSPVEIALKIGASPRTVEKDMLRLQQMGLYEFRVKEWQGYNLTQQKAREASEELKQAKAERKRLKTAQSNGGYLAENPAILPEPALNNRDSGYLAENEIPESLLPETFSSLVSTSDLQTSSDLDQNNLKEREKSKKDQISKSEEEEGNPQLSVEMKGSDPGSAQVARSNDWENFSAPGDEPDFFEFVVNKAAKFNDPVPADVRCATEDWIRKQGHLLYPEYLRWQDAQRQADERLASAAVEVTPPPQAELESESVEQRLQRYQMLWKTPVCRSGIKQMIANHPDWGLAIGPNGPQWAEAIMEKPVPKVTVVQPQAWASEPVLDRNNAIPEDLSDVLVEIDLHVRRLGWDAEQVI